MRLLLQACSDKGCIRDNNEDMVSVGGQLLRDGSLDMVLDTDECGNFCLLVADGMGGHEKGEEASGYVLESLVGPLREGESGSLEEFPQNLMDTVMNASAELDARAAEEGQDHPMGCTLTGLIWYGGKVFLVNAGDSRTYRFREGILNQLTLDETERGISGDPEGSKLLLNCIGGGCKGNLKVEDISGRILDSDMFLICSDGLTDMVSEEEISEILSEDLQPAVGLVERAKDNGGADNVSVIAVVVGEGEFAPGPSYDDEGPDDDGRFDAWA